MKKGFPADVSTLGGRIRQSRLDAGYTLKDFADLLKVSANHLGLVERGEKQASFKLLREISIKTNVSYQWLMKGDAQPSNGTDAAPDLQLLFGLILTMAPSINRATLANLLNVPVVTIDQILNGDNVVCDIEWSARLPILAGLLGNIPGVRQRMQGLDKFLDTVEFDRNMSLLKENLIQYIFQKCGRRFSLFTPISSHSSGPASNVGWTFMSLYDVEHPEVIWKFCIAEKSIPDDEDYEVAIDEIREYAMNATDKNLEELSLVFFNENDFENFDTAVNKEIDRLDGIAEGCAVLGESSPYSELEHKNLSYFFADGRSMEIIDCTCANDTDAKFWAGLSRPTGTEPTDTENPS